MDGKWNSFDQIKVFVQLSATASDSQGSDGFDNMKASKSKLRAVVLSV